MCPSWRALSQLSYRKGQRETQKNSEAATLQPFFATLPLGLAITAVAESSPISNGDSHETKKCGEATPPKFHSVKEEKQISNSIMAHQWPIFPLTSQCERKAPPERCRRNSL
ncbi:hypothetical protein TRVL_09175 [Trypanosoma vivax]|nr:hypothetical protein TRVL_09175 [Trypanosoma vivax]